MVDTKQTNPKDVIGSTKLPMGCVPSTLILYAAAAFAEGRGKYGNYNWRVTGVRSSVYFDAMQRHLHKWWNGEWADAETKVPHLASAIACIGIILDAGCVDKLVDDRPPQFNCAGTIKGLEGVCANLAELHKDMHPQHHFNTESGMAYYASLEDAARSA